MSEFHETRKLVENTFPETYGFTASRINDSLTELKIAYKYSDTKFAHIVVTHGSNVSTFSNRFAREAIVRINDRVDYCGISAATFKGRQIRLIKGGCAKHVVKDAAYDKYVEMAREKHIS